MLVILLVGGLLGATLIRFAPGFTADERALDARLSSESLQAIQQESSGEQNVLSFYANYLKSVITGNLGFSRVFQRPVTELLGERMPVTAVSVGVGISSGWLLGFGLALAVNLFRSRSLDLLGTFLSGLVLCIPIAVVALLFLFAGSSGRFAIALIIFPKVYRFAGNLLAKSAAMPHIVTARAKGLGRMRVLFMHVVPPAMPQLLALAGVTVSLAFTAAIPVEAIADSPGVGQLAWQAALQRDLPVLVNVTLFITAITLIANTVAHYASDMAGSNMAEPA
jgi:peptide/nickel transport system permease protein